MNPVNNNGLIILDRSRHETWQTCPRKRFLEYHWEGIGLQRVSPSAAPFTGQMVHTGLAQLILGNTVDNAVEMALAAYDAGVAARGVDAAEVTNSDYSTFDIGENWLIKSNRALVEALIRAYAMVRLPGVLRDFEILEVEREEEATFERVGRTIKFFARSDVLHRRRSDRQLFIRNFKTTSDALHTWQAAFAYDTQTISEVVAVEQRLKQAGATGNEARIHGVIIDGLIKQPRAVLKGYGDIKLHCSPLIWGWLRPGNPPIDKDDWQSQYEWQDDFAMEPATPITAFTAGRAGKRFVAGLTTCGKLKR